jgi:hypothetical protein
MTRREHDEKGAQRERTTKRKDYEGKETQRDRNTKRREHERRKHEEMGMAGVGSKKKRRKQKV